MNNSFTKDINDIVEHIISKKFVNKVCIWLSTGEKEVLLMDGFTVPSFKSCMEEIGFEPFANLPWPEEFISDVDTYGMVAEKNGIWYSCYYHFQTKTINVGLHEF